ncbi:HAD family hydrolase [Streptomyces sp. NPDC059629]|uniref:HAD family hydrolase n=1 Tax=Streptomyces sp. NPDC059629 TaxID=3346889 RepID=UPI00367629F5
MRGTSLLDSSGRPAAAVLFDCDGLLADTEPQWGTAMETVLRSHGHQTDDLAGLTSELTGASIESTVQRLTELLGLPGSSRGTIERTLLTAYAETVAQQGVHALPGAAALVRTVATSLPVAVVSNSPRDLVLLVLDAMGLTDVVAVVVGAHGTCRPKPDPAPYLLACQLLGVAATRCAAFEDSATGARAAVAAGLGVTVVPPADAVPDSYPVACRIVGSLAEVVGGPAVAASKGGGGD